MRLAISQERHDLKLNFKLLFPVALSPKVRRIRGQTMPHPIDIKLNYVCTTKMTYGYQSVCGYDDISIYLRRVRAKTHIILAD